MLLFNVLYTSTKLNKIIKHQNNKQRTKLSINVQFDCPCLNLSSSTERKVPRMQNAFPLTLTEERCRSRLMGDFGYPSSDLLHQDHSLLAPHTRRFDDERDEVDASNDVRILGILAQFGRRRCRPGQCAAGMDRRLRECVLACGVTRQTTISLLRH